LCQQAIAALPVGIAISDPQGKVLYVNESFSYRTGYRREEIVGRTCAFLEGPGTDPATRERIHAALRDGVPFEGEILHYRKDGAPFWDRLSLSPIRLPDGRLEGFVSLQSLQYDSYGTAQRMIGINHEVTGLRLLAGPSADAPAPSGDEEPVQRLVSP